MRSFEDRMKASVEKSSSTPETCKFCGDYILFTSNKRDEQYNEEIRVGAHIACMKRRQAKKKKK